MSKVIKIDSAEAFEEQLKKAGDKAVIVDFFAVWCGPCKMIAPKLEKMAEEFPTVVVLKVDVDEVEEVAAKYGIEAMPSFLVFKNGEEVKDKRLMGASEDKLKARFAELS